MNKFIAILSLLITTTAFAAISERDKAELGTQKNFITNGGAESARAGWASFADAAATSPVDGTGGSPSSTFTASSSSPLSGNYSFVWTKSANNRQGEGFSYAFTIDDASKMSVMSINFSYAVSSGTYADTDMSVWIYDVTNSALIQPAGYSLPSVGSGVSGKYVGNFQTSSSTSYRLIVFTGSTSASAYTLKFDNFYVGKQIAPLGTPATDWTAYTPTFTGWGTVSGTAFFWRRVGDSIQIRGNVVAGTSTATASKFTLPSGISISSTKVPAASYAGFATKSANQAAGMVLIADGSGSGAGINALGVGYQGASNPGLTQANGDVLVSSGQTISFFSTPIPVEGWSSNVAMSNDTDTRIVAALYTGNGGQAITGNTTNVSFATAAYDTHAAWSGSLFTAPVSGVYSLNGLVNITTNTDTYAKIYVNGSSYLQCFRKNNADSNIGVWGEVKLNVGDTVSVRINDNVTLSNSATIHWLAIRRLSGPAVVAASESVSARYSTTAGQTLEVAGAGEIINFDTREWDSHVAVTTGASWKFTAPVSGVYRVTSQIKSANVAWTAGNYMNLIIRKNGSLSVDWYRDIEATLTRPIFTSITGTVRLLAGDYIDIFFDHDRTGGDFTMATSAGSNIVSIDKVGNY